MSLFALFTNTNKSKFNPCEGEKPRNSTPRRPQSNSSLATNSTESNTIHTESSDSRSSTRWSDTVARGLSFSSTTKEDEDRYTPLPTKGSVKRRMKKARREQMERDLEMMSDSSGRWTGSDSGSSVSDHSEISVVGDVKSLSAGCSNVLEGPETNWTLEETEDGRGIVRFHFLDQVPEMDEEEATANG